MSEPGGRPRPSAVRAPGPGYRIFFKERRTEIDDMNGWVVVRGQECGVPTLLSLAAGETVHEVESGARPPAPGHFELTLRRAGI